MKTVSIITPAYNINSGLLHSTVDSIVSQTDKDFEWIIVVDGSRDVLYDRLDKEGITLRTAHLSHNYGPSVARNVGVQMAQGDVIAYVDIGDQLLESRVSNLKSEFENEEVEMLFSNYYIYQGPTVYAVEHEKLKEKYKFKYDIDYLGSLSEQANISIPLGVAHKRTLFNLAGGFQQGIVCGEDGILWRRMIGLAAIYDMKDKIVISSKIAGIYNVSETGQSRTQRRFDMGGFAFDGDHELKNGRYLDVDWFKNFHSRNLYERNEQ